MVKKHYGDADGLKLLSYNGIINCVLSNRNYGKTWTFKKRAFKRALKHNKKTIWLRLFKKEQKEAVATFYNSKDLMAYCGISPYDKETNPNGNFKQIGNTFYYRRHKKMRWKWFLKVFALSDVDAVRSADDVDVDTIIFDEFTKPPQKYKRYIGNIANDFIDVLFSSKREHKVNCILLGNKESVNNPIFSYFNIKPLPATFEGIRSYKKGSFIIQQINNVSDDVSDYDVKMRNLLNNTTYGNFIYKSDFKTLNSFKQRKTPSNASLYCQIRFNNQYIKISVLNGFFYVNDKIDKTKKIYCDNTTKSTNELKLVKRQKQLFISFINAIADNNVYYANALCYESILPFLQWLGI